MYWIHKAKGMSILSVVNLSNPIVLLSVESLQTCALNRDAKTPGLCCFFVVFFIFSFFFFFAPCPILLGKDVLLVHPIKLK